MNDIAFTPANIYAYDPIPTGRYGALDDVSPAVSVKHSSGKSYFNSLPDPTGISVCWKYPLSDNVRLKVSVGYQLQVFKGLLTSVGDRVPIYERIVNSSTSYVDLTHQQTGSFALPSTLMFQGEQYTARLRVLVFSEKGAGTLANEYFKYTSWGYVNFSINSKPVATSLRVDDSAAAIISSDEMPTFSFVFNDSDGPSYSYRIQVGTDYASFAPNIWDSGNIAAGPASGISSFSLAYAGQPLYAGTFYWRVFVNDGLTSGNWSPLSSFIVDNVPSISNLAVNGTRRVFSSSFDLEADLQVGTVFSLESNQIVVSWDYLTQSSYVQTAYEVVVVDTATSIVLFDSGEVFSSSLSTILPLMPVSGNALKLALRVRNTTTFSQYFFVGLSLVGKPTVDRVMVNGTTNPLAVLSSPAPTFSWVFTSPVLNAIQYAFRIKVARDQAFTSLAWDSGVVISGGQSVQYGTTASPVVSPATLTHGMYFVRVCGFDNVDSGLNSSDPVDGFFAINRKPSIPFMVSPSVGAYSGVITVNWLGSADADGDQLTYSLEITDSRSSNSGWVFLAGPFPNSATSFLFDTSAVPAGNDYGLRIVANDGFIDSDRTGGCATPVTSLGLGFTITQHAPRSPVILSPTTGDSAESLLRVEWIEYSPPSIDGTSVNYVLEMTNASSSTIPVWVAIGVFSAGMSSIIVDVSQLEDGVDYALRITAVDAKGNSGSPSASGKFSINNTPTITDFEMLNGVLFAGSSDGKIYTTSYNFWDVGNFKQFEAPNAKAVLGFDGLSLTCPAGTSCVFRDS